MRVLPLLMCAVASAAGFSCKDQNGNDVDWFTVQKMPKIHDNSIAGITSGYGFYYLDAHAKTALKPSANALNDNNQAVAHTLQQFYAKKGDESIFHVMYNDEPFGSVSLPRSNRVRDAGNRTQKLSVEFGHTKGVAFFDGTSGVWLVHSVPKFPPPDHYQYPESGTNYGQTMLCMTFTYSELSKIGTQLFYNHPDIYSSNLPTDMAIKNPDLQKVISGGYAKGTPGTSTIDLVTKGGQKFKSFAKNADFKQDLYDKLVAPGLRSPLVVESWRRGDLIPLDCSATYKVLDAQTMKTGSTSEYKYTKDHSKLARSSEASSPYVCIGDVNRMTSQYVRGGGTVCISDAAVWKAWSVIATQNSC